MFDVLCSLRLLFADDDPGVRELLRERLEADGANVIAEAVDGVEAVALALGLRPDLIVLDCAMPRLNGFGAARLIRAARPEACLILQSGELEDGYVEEACGLGVQLLDKRVLLVDPADTLEQALIRCGGMGRHYV